MLSRRTFVHAALGAGILAAARPMSASAAVLDPQEPRRRFSRSALTGGLVQGRTVGFSVANVIGDTIVPIETFRADIDRIVELGGNAVRLNFPLYLAGGFFGGTFYPNTSAATAIRAQLAYAASKGFAISLTVSAPAFDSGDRSLARTIAVNKPALEAIGTAVGAYVKVWQVLNEWNLAHYLEYYGLPTDLPLSYVDDVAGFLAAAAPVLRAAAPGSIVTTAVGGYPADPSMWRRWEVLLSRAGGALDAWGVTAYPDPDVPDQWSTQAASMQHMQSVAGKPVCVFETGMCTPAASSAQQAVTAVPGMLKGMAQGRPLVLFGYQLRDMNSGSSNGEDRFGVYTTAGARKLHWQATHDVTCAIVAGAYAV